MSNKKYLIIIVFLFLMLLPFKCVLGYEFGGSPFDPPSDPGGSNPGGGGGGGGTPTPTKCPFSPGDANVYDPGDGYVYKYRVNFSIKSEKESFKINISAYDQENNLITSSMDNGNYNHPDINITAGMSIGMQIFEENYYRRNLGMSIVEEKCKKVEVVKTKCSCTRSSGTSGDNTTVSSINGNYVVSNLNNYFNNNEASLMRFDCPFEVEKKCSDILKPPYCDSCTEKTETTVTYKYDSKGYVYLNYCLRKTGESGCRNKIHEAYQSFAQNKELKNIGNSAKSVIILPNSNSSGNDYIIYPEGKESEIINFNNYEPIGYAISYYEQRNETDTRACLNRVQEFIDGSDDPDNLINFFAPNDYSSSVLSHIYECYKKYEYSSNKTCVDRRNGEVFYGDKCNDSVNDIMVDKVTYDDDNNNFHWHYFFPLNWHTTDEYGNFQNINYSVDIQTLGDFVYSAKLCHGVMNEYYFPDDPNKPSYWNMIKPVSGEPYTHNRDIDIYDNRECIVSSQFNFLVDQKFYKENDNKFLGYNFYYRQIDPSNPFPNGRDIWVKRKKYDSDPTAFTEEEALEIVEKTDNSIWYNKWKENNDLNFVGSYNTIGYASLKNINEIRKLKNSSGTQCYSDNGTIYGDYLGWCNMRANGISNFVTEYFDYVGARNYSTMKSSYFLGCGSANEGESYCKSGGSS